MIVPKSIFQVALMLAILLMISVLTVSAAVECHVASFATQVSNALPQLGSAVHDHATFTLSDPARLQGTLYFWVCGPLAEGASCSTGGTPLTAVPVDVTTTIVNQPVTRSSPNYTPLAIGKYCFRVNFTAGPYNGFTLNTVTWPHVGGPAHPEECFTVNPSLTLTTNLGDDLIGPFSGTAPYLSAEGNAVTDYITLASDATAAISGTVQSFVCKASIVQACSTGGTALTPVAINQTLTAGVPSTITSPSYTLGTTGYYCFRTVYTAANDSAFPSAAYVGGTADTLTECTYVKSATGVTLSSFEARSGPSGGIYLGFAIAGALAFVGAGLLLARKNAFEDQV